MLTLEVVPPLVPSGGSSTLTASLNTNSDGGIAPCSVPDTTPVAFASTCGPVSAALATTTNGEATSAVTGGPIGTCEVSTAVDSEAASQQVQVHRVLRHSDGFHGRPDAARTRPGR